MRLRHILIAASLALAGCQSGGDTDASAGRTHGVVAQLASQAESDPRYAGLVLETGNGQVLYAENADALRYPASLTKLMTLYLLFEEIERGRLNLNSELAVSANAARQPASKLGLKAGSTIRVDDAILALAVKSSNDVATVVAESIDGSEAAFAARMTRTAHALGMNRTTFRNASGLPDPAQVTTARDMTALARALRQRFPRQSRVFATESFAFGGKQYQNTNELVGVVPGMDFSKTGYTTVSGYNLITSVERRGRRVIVVVFGAPSGAARSAQVNALLEATLPERRGWLAFGN